MNDAVRRAIRSFFQGFVGVLALVAIPMLTDLVQTTARGGEVVIDVNFLQGVGVAALAGGIISLVSFVQNALEDNTRMPALLKAPASDGQNPAP